MQEPRKLFVDLRTRLPGTEKVREEYREAHIAYLTRLKDEGKLIMGGPFEDGSEALNIFSASSQEEAMELCRNDPFVAHGVHECKAMRAWIVRIYQ